MMMTWQALIPVARQAAPTVTRQRPTRRGRGEAFRLQASPACLRTSGGSGEDSILLFTRPLQRYHVRYKRGIGVRFSGKEHPFLARQITSASHKSKTKPQLCQ